MMRNHILFVGLLIYLVNSDKRFDKFDWHPFRCKKDELTLFDKSIKELRINRDYLLIYLNDRIIRLDLSEYLKDAKQNESFIIHQPIDEMFYEIKNELDYKIKGYVFKFDKFGKQEIDVLLDHNDHNDRKHPYSVYRLMNTNDSLFELNRSNFSISDFNYLSLLEPNLGQFFIFDDKRLNSRLEVIYTKDNQLKIDFIKLSSSLSSKNDQLIYRMNRSVQLVAYYVPKMLSSNESTVYDFDLKTVWIDVNRKFLYFDHYQLIAEFDNQTNGHKYRSNKDHSIKLSIDDLFNCSLKIKSLEQMKSIFYESNGKNDSFDSNLTSSVRDALKKRDTSDQFDEFNYHIMKASSLKTDDANDDQLSFFEKYFILTVISILLIIGFTIGISALLKRINFMRSSSPKSSAYSPRKSKENLYSPQKTPTNSSSSSSASFNSMNETLRQNYLPKNLSKSPRNSSLSKESLASLSFDYLKNSTPLVVSSVSKTLPMFVDNKRFDLTAKSNESTSKKSLAYKSTDDKDDKLNKKKRTN